MIDLIVIARLKRAIQRTACEISGLVHGGNRDRPDTPGDVTQV
jgi:hypothetical protein